jgi:hypothetical protein
MTTVSFDIKIDYQFILFVLFAIMACSTAPVYFYNRNKYFAGFVSLILFILIFVFFGMRWFSDSEMVGPGAGYKGAWPPQIAVCPDYFTYFKVGDKEACYNGSGSRIGDIDSLGSPPNSIDFTASTLNIFQPYKSGGDKGTLCRKAIEKKVAWEGLTDGDSCTF